MLDDGISDDLWGIISDYCDKSVIFNISKTIRNVILNHMKSITYKRDVYDDNRKVSYSCKYNGVPHGIFNTYINKKLYQSYFFHGLSNGYCNFVYYNTDYQKYMLKKGRWIDGKYHGKITDHYLNGNIVEEKFYNMGKLELTYKIWSYDFKGHKILLLHEKLGHKQMLMVSNL